jgi:hypothetical protein
MYGNFAVVLNLNDPSMSVDVPLGVPDTLILAPGIDCLLLSETEPVTVFCEKDNPLINNRISKYTLIG